MGTSHKVVGSEATNDRSHSAPVKTDADQPNETSTGDLISYLREGSYCCLCLAETQRRQDREQSFTVKQGSLRDRGRQHKETPLFIFFFFLTI